MSDFKSKLAIFNQKKDDKKPEYKKSNTNQAKVQKAVNINNKPNEKFENGSTKKDKEQNQKNNIVKIESKQVNINNNIDKKEIAPKIKDEIISPIIKINKDNGQKNLKEEKIKNTVSSINTEASKIGKLINGKHPVYGSKKIGEEIEVDKNNLINEIKEDLFKEKTNKNNMAIVHDDKNQELKSLNKKYLKIIFALSLMFNNIIAVIIKNKDEQNEEIVFKLNNKIKCSSIERQFLLNILNIFKEQKSFIYNHLLESYIFGEATKKYNRHLFHKVKENEKVSLPCNSIINAMTAGISENNNNEQEQEDKTDKSKNINYENKKFIKAFVEFYTKYQFIFDQKEVKPGFIGSLFNKKILQYIDTSMGKMVNYAIHNFKLTPIVNRKISSFQVTIIIDGYISPEIIFESDEKYLSHKEKLNNFFTNSIYLNGDFYCYDWQSLSYPNKVDFKEVSTFYGILLAYIIISKLFFQFQTINLIGYSTGCKIIKSCLTHLHQLKKEININDIINNIILIGGASHFNLDKYPYLFDNISGKVVNIFSKKDNELLKYKKTAVGLNELKLKKEYENKYNYDIVNIDLSKKFVKQDEYLMELPKILIKDFNIN